MSFDGDTVVPEEGGDRMTAMKGVEKMTLYDSFAHFARLLPEKDFLIHRDRSSSYGEVFGNVAGFAGYLLDRGITAGDRICLVLPRVPELVISFLAAVRIGAVPAPVNYTLGREEVNGFISRVRPTVIVAHADFITTLDDEILGAPGCTCIVVNGTAPGSTPWEEVSQARELDFSFSPGFDEISYLNFTTGSTGLPKGAIATHSNIYWNTRSLVEAFAITGEDIHLCMFASFAHPHELFARAVYTGGTVVLLEEVHPRTIVRIINRHRVTCMMGLAPMYAMILTHCRESGLESLRIAESGGMYTPPGSSREFQEAFGVPILSVWGSTETSGVALANTPERFRTDGSMGRPCPFYDVRLVDEDGNDVPAGEAGELLFRGKGVVAGYDEGLAYAGAEGWYQSGDLARRDGEGFYYFVERKSGMIKVAGLKVYPLQVELVLQEHPAIKEVAVKGVRERRHGMVPHAFVVTHEGMDIDLDELTRFCRGRLANYMIPKGIRLLPELPKIGSGKVNKKALPDE